jgi:DNA-binding MarR family transcriptional regulator
MGSGHLVGHLLRRCHQVHNAVWADVVGGILTSPQYSVLYTVSTGPAAVDQQAVGLGSGLDRTTVGGVIRRLEAQGWLRRDRDPVDARRQVITITAPARVALEGLAPQVRTVQQRFLAPLEAGDREWFSARLADLAGLGDRTDPDGGPVAGGDLRPGHLIRLAQQRHAALWAEELEGLLTGPQYAVLRVLDRTGPLGQGTLAERAALDRSSASEVLARMEGRGLIARRSDPGDRRTREVSLTGEGAGVVHAAGPAVGRVQSRILAPVPAPERDRTLAALTAVAGPCDAALAHHTGGQ